MKSLLGALLEGRLVQLPSTDKDSALQYLAHLIEAIPDMSQKIDLAEEMLKRERSAGCGIGMGVACPHVRSLHQGDLVCAVGWSPEGIDYGASDGMKVHLVVMYLIPEIHMNDYLKEISVLSDAVKKGGDIQTIARADDIASVREHLLGWVTAALETGTPQTKVRMIHLEARQRAVASLQETTPAESGRGAFRRSFDRKIDELRERVSLLGALASSLVALTVKLMEEENGGSLAEISKIGDQIEELEDQIDTFTLGLIALHQPLGSDIRLLYVIPKIVSDLGRIAGQSMRLAGKIPGFRSAAPRELLERMRSGLELSRAMLRECLEAFASRSGSLASQVFPKEDPVESFCAAFFLELVGFMRGYGSPPPEAYAWSQIPHHLERIAHYSRTICEEILFWIHGQKARHRHDDGSELVQAQESLKAPSGRA
jgi:phosphate uptake regulator/mannitol/fructose-specific phosphotransferase system IIA component (Ntr-type)